MMHDPKQLRRWITRAFEAAESLPLKAKKSASPRPRKTATRRTPAK
jgi:hypothetical protein